MKVAKMPPLATVDDFFAWFRASAEELPSATGDAVREALAQGNHRLTYIQLDKLRTAGELPEPWAERLSEFYSRFF